MATENAGPRSGTSEREAESTPVLVVQSFSLAAYLKARGYPAQVRLQGSATSRCEFLFPETADVLADAEGYHQKAVVIAPQSLEWARRELSKMMGSAKRGER